MSIFCVILEAKVYKKNERHNEIIEILKFSRYATVDYLASELHISPSSIRRDLAALEAMGSVTRSHGGVSLTVSDNLNISFAMRMKSNSSEKRKIAEKAIDLVCDGDVVFVDASSTTMHLIHRLTDKKGITVITNGIPALHYLSDFKMKVICTGGTLDSEDRAALVGNEAMRVVRDMRANIAFISPQAIDSEGVLFDCYREEAAVTRQMIECAALKVCLCDSSKIGKSSTFKQCSFSDLDVVVCDTPLGDIFGEKFPKTKFI